MRKRGVAASTPTAADARPDPLVLALDSELSTRVRVLSIGILLMFAAMLAGWQAASLWLVPAVLFGFAVYLPNGPPSSSYMGVTAAMLLRSSNDCIAGCYMANKHWREVLLAGGLLQHVHGMRMLLSIVVFAADVLLAYDAWQLKGARLWGGVRCLMAMGCVLRMVANWRIRNIGAAASSDSEYLPGALGFATSVFFNVGCMALSLGLSATNRHRLSASCGAASVVCSLSELPTPPAEQWHRILPVEQDASFRSNSSRPRDRGGAASFPSNSSAVSSAGGDLSSAASELGRALAEAPGRLSSPDAARVGLPTYQLLPQTSRDNAIDLPASVRSLLRLHVRGGLLVDAHGCVLAPGGEAEGMYVMDELGTIFTTLCIEQRHGQQLEQQHGKRYQQQHEQQTEVAALLAGQCVRHSSLVASGPVAAAGMMTVARGTLLGLSNESGQYAPPPSCLHAVLDQFAGLGVTTSRAVVASTHRRVDHAHTYVVTTVVGAPPA